MSVVDVQNNVSPEEVEKLFKAVIAQKIPIGEHIDFVFMIENVSVSWREQAVRHRIGTEISPERLGIDLLPDLAKSSWWSQSMRIQNMGKFATEEKYRMPQTIANHGNPILKELFSSTMLKIEDAYNELVEQGIPMEDARELIPLGAQHRISWKLNIGALQHIVGKRGCWILQLGIWGPVIKGMIDELATKVHPVFRDMVKPPCINDEDKFGGCVYHEECNRRLDGRDLLPPCPLHYFQHIQQRDPMSWEDFKDTILIDALPFRKEMASRALEYQDFWGRNPCTGERELARDPEK